MSAPIGWMWLNYLRKRFGVFPLHFNLEGFFFLVMHPLVAIRETSHLQQWWFQLVFPAHACVYVDVCVYRCTWSEHQYQVANMVRPRVMPGQGRSPVTASLNRCMASWRGRWQVLFGMILLGTAMLYTRSRFPYPPILLKAVDQWHTTPVIQSLK